MLARFQEMGFDLDEFVPALLSAPTSCFRINTLKGLRQDVLNSLSDLKPEPVGWNDLVYRTDPGERKLGKLAEHFLGLIYVQDSSSTIPVTVLDPQPGEEILDMAAAPGSKTTQIAVAMDNQGLLVANEVSAKRIAALTGNLDRTGVINTVVVNQPGQVYGYILPDHFDRILLDAPCSSEGTLSRNLRGLEIWSEKSIERLSRLQRKLILSSYYALKPGGIMVYSTCTFAPEENEGTVSYLLDKFPDAIVDPIRLEGLDANHGFTRWRGVTFHPSVRNFLRLFPHQHDGEGFCVAKIRKPAGTFQVNPKQSPGGVSRNKRGSRKGKAQEPQDKKAEREMIEKTLISIEERFGIPAEFYKQFYLFTRKNDVWCTTREAGQIQLSHVTRRGLRIARTFEHSVRMTTNAVQLFGHLVTCNRVGLNEHEMQRFLAGETQKVKPPLDVSDGFVVAFNSGYALGVGLLKQGNLKSQVPRSRRVIA